LSIAIDKGDVMDTISLQNTNTLEKVFAQELLNRKVAIRNRQFVLFGILAIASILLALYVLTPLHTIIQ
jgi:hypothetical protein